MKVKRERAPLLMQEAPVLSDEMPSPDKSQPQQSKQSKGWRKRLFGGGKKRNQKQAHSAEQPTEQQSIPQADSGASLPNVVESTFSQSDASSANSKGDWDDVNHLSKVRGSQDSESTQTHSPRATKNQRLGRRTREGRDDSTASTTDQVVEELLQSEADLVPNAKSLNDRARSSSSKSSKKTDSSKKSQSSRRTGDPINERTRSASSKNSQSSKNSSDGINERTRSSSSKGSKKRPPKLDAAVAKLAESPASSTESSFSALSPVADSEPDWDPTPKLSKAGSTLTVKALLSRPFGRENLDSSSQTWIVSVSSAEWEPEGRVWKYRVTIRKRVFIDNKERLHEVTNGFTFRSLADFHWLEQSLMKEFQGGLLLPSLAIILGVPDLENTQHEVDADLLTSWLSDVLNGVRGQGELMLSHQLVDLVSSESMEAFLYRNAIPLNSRTVDFNMFATPKPPEQTERPRGDETKEENALWKILPDLLCAGACQGPAPSHERVVKLPLNMVNCSSRALGDAAAFDVQDSFVDGEGAFEQQSSSLVVHSDLLEAEKELVWNWRTCALTAIEKMRVMSEQEKHIGAAWKRFAISMSNLFAYEKDIESARFGDSKSKREVHIPHRKLQKSAVDDCLRVLARQKVERSSPALDALDVMLNAYVADLSAVGPSVAAYTEGVKNWGAARTRHAILAANRKKQEKKKLEPMTLSEQLKAGFEQVKKLANQEADGDMTSSQRLEEEEQEREQQLKAVEFKILQNEMLLRDSLTHICKSARVRTARPAYRYFNIEAMQCAMLHSAAATMKNKITIASKDTLAKMAKQHEQEAREDHGTEMQLIQRMVNIGNAKRFQHDDGTKQEGGVEIDTEAEDEEVQKAILRDKALERCRERIGRWDAKLALSILEAVGVDDADVRVEETTRDLRMIRKYAIGLRENLQRSVEALDMLKSTIFHGGSGDVRYVRQAFFKELQQLFSTTYAPATGDDGNRKASSPSVSILQGAGIIMNDPSGWRRNDKGSCGDPLASYVDAREYGTSLLLDSMDDMLKSYFSRVEAVESFVYMDCVGIQLEKHFSQRRATALASFEKKTDITSAINIATRKRMPLLVSELQAKLEGVGPDVSHTTVKEAKEAHLESKTLKTELHDLAVRRLTRARETSTERVIALLAIWSKEEEAAASTELKILKEVIRTMEMSIGRDAVEAYLGENSE